MHRLTARLLLMFSLAGVLVPAALAFSVNPPHACCRRKTPHCHNSAMPTDQPAVYAAGCDQHSCCRGLVVAQVAQPKPQVTARSLPEIHCLGVSSQFVANATSVHASHSVRGPPAPAIA